METTNPSPRPDPSGRVFGSNSEIDFRIEQLVAVEANDPNFHILELQNREFGDSGARALSEVLRYNTQVERLDLVNVGIGVDGASALADCLCENSSVKFINLSNNEIGHPTGQALGKMLTKNNSIVLLSLFKNRLGPTGSKPIAEALARNKTLTSLDLASNRIGTTSAEILALSLLHNSTMFSLDIANNRIGVDGAHAIAEALKINKTLTHLDVSRNNITDDGATALAAALSTNNSLLKLGLSENNLGVIAMESLAEALLKNNTLQELDIRWNSIGSTGAEVLSIALLENSTISSVDLWGAGIGDMGAVSIAEMLEQNKTIVYLKLWDNNIGPEGCTAIAEALSHNNVLLSLDIGYNAVGSVGAASLGKVLQKGNSTLETLKLWYNNIGREGAISLSHSIRDNKTLTYLDVGANGIGNDGASALAESLRHNKFMLKIEMGCNGVGVSEWRLTDVCLERNRADAIDSKRLPRDKDQAVTLMLTQEQLDQKHQNLAEIEQLRSQVVSLTEELDTLHRELQKSNTDRRQLEDLLLVQKSKVDDSESLYMEQQRQKDHLERELDLEITERRRIDHEKIEQIQVLAARIVHDAVEELQHASSHPVNNALLSDVRKGLSLMAGLNRQLTSQLASKTASDLERRREVARLQDQVLSFGTELADLRATHLSTINQAELEKTKDMQVISELRDQLGSLAAQCLDAQKEAEELRSRVVDLLWSEEAKTQEVDDLSVIVGKQSADLDRCRTELARMESMRNELERSETRSLQMIALLEEKEAHLDELRLAHAQWREEHNRLVYGMEDSSETVDELRSSITRYENDFSVVLSRADHARNRSEEMVSSYEIKQAQLMKQLDAKDQEIDRLINEVKRSKENARDNITFTEERLIEKMELLQAEVRGKDKKIDEYNRKLANAVESFETDRSRYRDLLAVKENEIITLKLSLKRSDFKAVGSQGEEQLAQYELLLKQSAEKDEYISTLEDKLQDVLRLSTIPSDEVDIVKQTVHDAKLSLSFEDKSAAELSGELMKANMRVGALEKEIWRLNSQVSGDGKDLGTLSVLGLSTIDLETWVVGQDLFLREKDELFESMSDQILRESKTFNEMIEFLNNTQVVSDERNRKITNQMVAAKARVGELEEKVEDLEHIIQSREIESELLRSLMLRSMEQTESRRTEKINLDFMLLKEIDRAEASEADVVSLSSQLKYQKEENFYLSLEIDLLNSLVLRGLEDVDELKLLLSEGNSYEMAIEITRLRRDLSTVTSEVESLRSRNSSVEQDTIKLEAEIANLKIQFSNNIDDAMQREKKLLINLKESNEKLDTLDSRYSERSSMYFSKCYDCVISQLQMRFGGVGFNGYNIFAENIINECEEKIKNIISTEQEIYKSVLSEYENINLLAQSLNVTRSESTLPSNMSSIHVAKNNSCEQVNRLLQNLQACSKDKNDAYLRTSDLYSKIIEKLQDGGHLENNSLRSVSLMSSVRISDDLSEYNIAPLDVQIRSLESLLSSLLSEHSHVRSLLETLLSTKSSFKNIPIIAKCLDIGRKAVEDSRAVEQQLGSSLQNTNPRVEDQSAVQVIKLNMKSVASSLERMSNSRFDLVNSLLVTYDQARENHQSSAFVSIFPNSILLSSSAYRDLNNTIEGLRKTLVISKKKNATLIENSKMCQCFGNSSQQISPLQSPVGLNTQGPFDGSPSLTSVKESKYKTREKELENELGLIKDRYNNEVSISSSLKGHVENLEKDLENMKETLEKDKQEINELSEEIILLRKSMGVMQDNLLAFDDFSNVMEHKLRNRSITSEDLKNNLINLQNTCDSSLPEIQKLLSKTSEHILVTATNGNDIESLHVEYSEICNLTNAVLSDFDKMENCALSQKTKILNQKNNIEHLSQKVDQLSSLEVVVCELTDEVESLRPLLLEVDGLRMWIDDLDNLASSQNTLLSARLESIGKVVDSFQSNLSLLKSSSESNINCANEIQKSVLHALVESEKFPERVAMFSEISRSVNESLQTTVMDMSNEIKSQKERMMSLSTLEANLKATVTSLKIELDSELKAVARLDADISRKDALVNKVQGRCDDLHDQIRILRDHVKDLENFRDIELSNLTKNSKIASEFIATLNSESAANTSAVKHADGVTNSFAKECLSIREAFVAKDALLSHMEMSIRSAIESAFGPSRQECVIMNNTLGDISIRNKSGMEQVVHLKKEISGIGLQLKEKMSNLEVIENTTSSNSETLKSLLNEQREIVDALDVENRSLKRECADKTNSVEELSRKLTKIKSKYDVLYEENQNVLESRMAWQGFGLWNGVKNDDQKLLSRAVTEELHEELKNKDNKINLMESAIEEMRILLEKSGCSVDLSKYLGSGWVSIKSESSSKEDKENMELNVNSDNDELDLLYLRRQVADQEAELDSLQAELDRARSERSNETLVFEKLKRELLQKNEELSKLHQSSGRYSSMSTSKESITASASLQQIKNDLHEAVRRFASRDADAEALNECCLEAQSVLYNKSNELAEVQQRLVEQNEDMHRLRNEVEHVISMTENALVGMQRELEAAIGTVATVSTTSHIPEPQITSTIVVPPNVTDRLKRLEEENNQLKNDKTQLKSKYSVVEDQVSELTSSNERLKARIGRLERELISLTEQSDVLNASESREIINLKRENSAAQSHIKTLNEELSSSESEVSRLQDELFSQSATMEKLRGQVDNAVRREAQSSAEINNLKNDIKQLRSREKKSSSLSRSPSPIRHRREISLANERRAKAEAETIKWKIKSLSASDSSMNNNDNSSELLRFVDDLERLMADMQASHEVTIHEAEEQITTLQTQLDNVVKNNDYDKNSMPSGVGIASSNLGSTGQAACLAIESSMEEFYLLCAQASKNIQDLGRYCRLEATRRSDSKRLEEVVVGVGRDLERVAAHLQSQASSLQITVDEKLRDFSHSHNSVVFFMEHNGPYLRRLESDFQRVESALATVFDKFNVVNTDNQILRNAFADRERDLGELNASRSRGLEIVKEIRNSMKEIDTMRASLRNVVTEKELLTERALKNEDQLRMSLNDKNASMKKLQDIQVVVARSAQELMSGVRRLRMSASTDQWPLLDDISGLAKRLGDSCL